jgi:hypothetical protein
MPTFFLIRLRRLLADTHGHSFVQYSSLALLLAIAALAVCVQFGHAAPPTPERRPLSQPLPLAGERSPKKELPRLPHVPRPP